MQSLSSFRLDWRQGAFAALVAAACLWVGCSESPDSNCGVDEDCADHQQCVEGVCQVTGEDECQIDSDCPGGFYCDNFECKPQQSPDAGPSDADDDGGDPDPDTTSGSEDTDAADDEGPAFVDSTPEDGDDNVDVDADITLEFSEPIRDDALHSDALSLLGPNGNSIEIFGSEGDVEQTDPGTLVISVDVSLREASPYRVVLTEFLRDEARNPLREAPVEMTFSTSWDEPPAHVMAARKWAPWIYQGIGDTSGDGPADDLPTTVDFDGDLDASNNRANAGDAGARLYYHVIESETHLYLFYLLYYPAYQAQTGDEPSEHHFAGAVSVVDKATDELVVVDGVRLENNAPDWISFTEENSGIEGIGNYSPLLEVPTDKWQLEDGTHYPMYVKAGNHETCHWYVSGNPNQCIHTAEEFNADDGIVLQPGDRADGWDDRSSEAGLDHETMTYELVPLVRHFWALRTLTGGSGLFDDQYTYEPNDVDSSRPSGYLDAPNQSHRVPEALNSTDDDSSGATPFRWESFSNGDGNGQWMLDPAFVTSDRFLASGNNRSEFSQTYCHNLFFGIDRRSSQSEPDCAATSGGDAGQMGDADAGGGADTGF